MGKERKDKEFSAGEQEIQAVFARLCPLVTDALSLEKCELKLSDRPAELGADSLDMLIVAGKAEKAFDIRIDIHRAGWDKHDTLRDNCTDIVRLQKESGLL